MKQFPTVELLLSEENNLKENFNEIFLIKCTSKYIPNKFIRYESIDRDQWENIDRIPVAGSI